MDDRTKKCVSESIRDCTVQTEVRETMVRDWIRVLLDTEFWRFVLWIGLCFWNFAVLEGWGRK